MRERFGDDIGTVVLSIHAVTAWQLGEVDRARQLIDAAAKRADELGHGLSNANPCVLEIRSRTAAWRCRRSLERGKEAGDSLGREQGTPFWLVAGECVSGWARGRLGDPAGGAAQLQRAVASLADQGDSVNFRFNQGLLAEIEAEASGIESALARIDEALTDADQVEYRAFDQRFIASRARQPPAEARFLPIPYRPKRAYRTAIAIAKGQGARSFELLAALSLARLHQSTGRPADAHAVLAPALEGFAPTPEMPEIAEAQALLAALTETDEVKSEAARRRRDAQLRVAYGNALIPARGYGAPETAEAFAAAREQADGDSAAPERLAADYGLWANSYTRGDLSSMQAYASSLPRRCQDETRIRPRPASPIAPPD